MSNTASRKLTDLQQVANVNANVLLYVVLDPTGIPSSNSISVQGLFESNVSANVVANGSLVISGKAISNVVVVKYNSTPANSASVPTGFANNTMWSDGNFLYVVTSASQIKRIALSTW